MDLVIGFDNFGKIVSNKLDFVDKSLFIKEIIDDKITEVSLITRPRRFGKTFNISMLHHFLAAEVEGLTTKDLFKGLKISQAGKEYTQHQGQYPVIFISFKDVKDGDFDTAYRKLCLLIASKYKEHRYLLSSPELYDEDKRLFEQILEGQLQDQASLENSLKNLTRFLHQHHKVKPWLLIDEYDTPIQASYIGNYYDKMISIMRGMFGAALKSNPYLYRSVITGILRVSKESLFSGLNNIRVYSIVNPVYSEYFGFTEAEVEDLLNKTGLISHYAEIKKWYNGYIMGENTVVYNPWSIANTISERGKLRPYWINTSDNALIKKLLARADPNVKKHLESILREESIEALINENLVFGDLYTNKDAIWSLLLFSGYLKVSRAELQDAEMKCLLSVPNKEVLSLYRSTIQKWFTDPLGETSYLEFLASLTEGRIDEFSHRLKRFLMESASFFDASGKYPEKFYHGFVMGMIVSLSNTHTIQSNRESGYGRYDVMIIPKDQNKLGVILEFKVTDEEERDLKEVAQEALQQIIDRQYEAEMKQKGIKNIIKLGLAFRGKEVCVLQYEKQLD